MSDFKEYKNRKEELEEIIGDIKEDAVQQNNLLPTLDATSEKYTKIFEVMLIDIQKATNMKNIYKYELSKGKVTVEELEKRLQSEHEKISKMQSENLSLNCQLIQHQDRKAKIVKCHEESMNELGERFRKAPILYGLNTMQTEVGAIAEKLAKTNVETKTTNNKILMIQVSYLNSSDEDVDIQSKMEVQEDFDALNMLTETFTERLKVLEKYKEKLAGDIREIVHRKPILKKKKFEQNIK